MARIKHVMPLEYPNGINFFRYQTADHLPFRQQVLDSVVRHLKLTDIVSYQNCISYCSTWQTNDGDHYPTFYQNSQLELSTGANSQVVVFNTTEQYTTRSSSGVKINIYGVTAHLPLAANVADVHTAVMLCDYAIEKLRKMRPEEAKNSPLFKLKQSLENDLKAMKNGTQTTLKTPIFEYISEGTFIEVQKRAENRARILAMIDSKLIPPETKDKKYPLDEETLAKILPVVQQKYQMQLARQEHKALVKKQRQELKLAKIEKRKQLKDERQRRKEAKAKQKKEREELKNSINEAQIL